MVIHRHRRHDIINRRPKNCDNNVRGTSNGREASGLVVVQRLMLLSIALLIQQKYSQFFRLTTMSTSTTTPEHNPIIDVPMLLSSPTSRSLSSKTMISNNTTGNNSPPDLVLTVTVNNAQEQGERDENTAGTSNPSSPPDSSSSNTNEDDCETPIGYDVCIIGEYYGNNFNRIMSVANALYEVELLSSSRNRKQQSASSSASFLRLGDSGRNDTAIAPSNTTPTAKQGVVRLLPENMEWFQKFFDPNPNQIRLVSHQCLAKSCRHQKSWEYYFWFHTQKTQEEASTDEFHLKKVTLQQKQRFQNINTYRLFGMWKYSFVEHGKEQYQFYKEFYSGKYIITVHQRWIEGTCPRKAKKGMNACINSGKQGKRRIPPVWVQACSYTYDYVRSQLPGKYTPDNSVLILMGDNQRMDFEETFPIRDQSHFAVQIVMMTMSDYHVGNPQSTVDANVAYWRRGRKSFPENC